MNKNQHITSLDLHQMQLRALDEQNDAQRVVVVGQELNIDSSMLKEAISEGLKDIKIDIPNSQKETLVIEVPTIVKETVIERIEIPKIVYETKIVEVEKPIIITEVKIVEVEKPIIVTEVKFVEIVKEKFDKSFLYINVSLTILNILLILSKLIK